MNSNEADASVPLTRTDHSAISIEDRQHEGRKPRTCKQMCKPLMVLTLLIMSCCTFFVLAVAPRTKFWTSAKGVKYVPPTAGDVVSWIFFFALFVLTVWSLYVMVTSSPGYIPNNYKYDPEKMTPHDRLIYD